MEQGKRIELSASAWKAEVLPLYEPCVNTNYAQSRTCINFGTAKENRTPLPAVKGRCPNR